MVPLLRGLLRRFVEQALESATTAALVLDPWNGTGTTTVVAASKNIPAIGFDVNPALVVVSRARLIREAVRDKGYQLTPIGGRRCRLPAREAQAPDRLQLPRL